MPLPANESTVMNYPMKLKFRTDKFQNGSHAITSASSLKHEVIRFHVRPHVHHEMTRPVELMSAQLTFVRLDTRVRSHVLHETTRQHELLGAQLALVWPFASVGAHVHHPVPGTLERLSAYVARVWLHARVRGNVRR